MTEAEKVIFKDAIMVYGVDSQVDMAIEEMSELTKALLKYRRVKNGDESVDHKYKALDNLIEEIEDVQIMLDQLELIYGHNDGIREHKVYRLKERLKGEIKC